MPPVDNVKDHILRNIEIPFLDHVLGEMEARFSCLLSTPSTLLSLVPSVLCVQEVDIADAVEI